ncbi:MAG TPA: hypothetical protein VGF75_01020 [Candidatus Saccharimonadales bacterium]
MSDDAMKELKKFIAGLLVQSDVATKKGFARVNGRLDDLSFAVADTMSKTNDHIFAQLDNHGGRLIKLEEKVG